MILTHANDVLMNACAALLSKCSAPITRCGLATLQTAIGESTTTAVCSEIDPSLSLAKSHHLGIAVPLRFILEAWRHRDVSTALTGAISSTDKPTVEAPRRKVEECQVRPFAGRGFALLSRRVKGKELRTP